MSMVQAQQAARSRQLRPEAHVPVAVSEVLRPGALLRELELRVAEQTGSQFALVMSSLEEAARVAVEAVGLQAGDQVGIPITAGRWLFSVLEQSGFQVVALPVDMSSLTICPQAAEEALQRGCRALVVEHLHGRRAAAAELQALVMKYGACLVEDATQAVRVECLGRCAGTWGRAGLFSLGDPGEPAEQLHGILASSPAVVGRIADLQSAQSGADSAAVPVTRVPVTRVPVTRVPATRVPVTSLDGPCGDRVLRSLDWLTAVASRQQRWRQQWSIFRARLTRIPGLRVLDMDLDGGEVPSALDLLVDRPQELIEALSSNGIACERLVVDAEVLHLWARWQAPADSRAGQQLNALVHAVSIPWTGELSNAQITSICEIIDRLLRRSLAA